jgi:hypothetical protein
VIAALRLCSSNFLKLAFKVFPQVSQITRGGGPSPFQNGNEIGVFGEECCTGQPCGIENDAILGAGEIEITNVGCVKAKGLCDQSVSCGDKCSSSQRIMPQ